VKTAPEGRDDFDQLALGGCRRCCGSETSFLELKLGCADGGADFFSVSDGWIDGDFCVIALGADFAHLLDSVDTSDVSAEEASAAAAGHAGDFEGDFLPSDLEAGISDSGAEGSLLDLGGIIFDGE